MNAPRPPDDSVSKVLATWRVRPRPDPEFRAGVWARIEQARQPSQWPQFARANAGLVAGLLGCAVAIGAWRGRAEAQHTASADSIALAKLYVHRLDARWMRQP